MKYYRRIGVFLVLVIFISGLTGCNSYEIELTDQESDEIAEYMSYLFLKYDKNYHDDLVTPTPTPTPRPTKIPTITPTPEPEADNPKNASGTAIAASPTPTPIDPNIQSNEDFAGIIGLKDLSVKYIGYELRDQYYGNHYIKDSDNNKQSEVLSFSIEAADKKNQLLFVSFELENLKSKSRTLDLRKSEILYQIDINTGLINKPLLTLFDNDLQYINISMDANQKETGVVVFEIPKDINLEKVYIMISKGSKTAIIKII